MSSIDKVVILLKEKEIYVQKVLSRAELKKRLIASFQNKNNKNIMQEDYYKPGNTSCAYKENPVNSA